MLHAGLGEERYDAMICVPIVSRSDRLVGVVSVWSASRDRFTADHVRLAEWIAVVVAGAIENARLHATMSRRTRVLERMAELSTMTAWASPRPACSTSRPSSCARWRRPIWRCCWSGTRPAPTG